MSFELNADMVGGKAPPRAQPDSDLATAQEALAFARLRGAQAERRWQEMLQAEWQEGAPLATLPGAAQAAQAHIDAEIDSAVEEAPSAEAAAELERELQGPAARDRAQAVMRTRATLLGEARARLGSTLGALQQRVAMAPEQLDAALAEADATIEASLPLLPPDSGAALRLAFRQSAARRAIGATIARDARAATAGLPGAGVLERGEIAAWDAVALARAEVQRDLERGGWARRFADDLRRIAETGEPGFDLAAWVVEASGGDGATIGPRLKEAEALAERHRRARQAALEAHRRFQTLKFAAPAIGDADTANATEETTGQTPEDIAWGPQAEDSAAHLRRLQQAHAARLQRDPAAVAFEHDAVERAWREEKIGEAMHQAQALQRRMGVASPRALPRAVAARLAGTLEKMAPPARIAALRGLARAAGAQAPALLAALASAGLSPFIVLAGLLPLTAGGALEDARADDGERRDDAATALAQAAFARTALARRLHEGAARHGGSDPAWDDAYRVAEAMAARVGARLARSEGDAGAARAAALLFGSLEGDARALAGVMVALGVPADVIASDDAADGRRQAPAAEDGPAGESVPAVDPASKFPSDGYVPALLDFVHRIEEATPETARGLLLEAVELFPELHEHANFHWIIRRNADLPMGDPERAGNFKHLQGWATAVNPYLALVLILASRGKGPAAALARSRRAFAVPQTLTGALSTTVTGQLSSTGGGPAALPDTAPGAGQATYPETTLEILPAIHEALVGPFVMEKRRGNEITKEGNDIVIEECRKAAAEIPAWKDGFKHTGGGRADGVDVKETYIPPTDEFGRVIKGTTRGSSYADITFTLYDPATDSEFEFHINTTDMRNGRMTPREQRGMARLIKNLRQRTSALAEDIPKLRPDDDRQEYREMVRRKCREMLQKGTKAGKF